MVWQSAIHNLACRPTGHKGEKLLMCYETVILILLLLGTKVFIE